MRVSVHRVQRAVEFIEAHLHDPITPQDVADVAGMSRYHLHRLFTAAYGETLMAYVRKRRLTEAAQRLRASDDGILEIALSSGFGSQEAFTRAFRGMYQVTPGQYRRDRSQHGRPGLLPARPGSVGHRYRGVTQAPRLRRLESPLRLVGSGVAADFENDASIMDAWRPVFEAVRDLDPDTVVLHGVAQASHPAIPQRPEQSLAYIASLSADVDVAWPVPVVEVEIPAGDYAVFDHDAPLERVVETVNYVWASWLPRCEHLKSTRPDLEIIRMSEMASPRPHLELWVSIERAPRPAP